MPGQPLTNFYPTGLWGRRASGEKRHIVGPWHDLRYPAVAERGAAMGDEQAERNDLPHAPDPMEDSFDQLRLRATRLRMLAEENSQSASEILTGNPETDALLKHVLSTLTGQVTALAADTDQTVGHFHPLYQNDMRGHKRSDRKDIADG